MIKTLTPLNYGPNLVTNIQILEDRKEGISNVVVDKTGSHHLNQVSRVNITSDNLCRWRISP